MDYIFDVFIFLIVILFSLISAQKGFVRSAWGTITIIASFIVSYAFSADLGEYICQEYVLPWTTEYTFEILESLITATDGNYDIAALFASLPQKFSEFAERCGADIDRLAEQFVESVTIPKESVYELAESIAEPISRSISDAIAVISLFFTAILIFLLFGLVVKAITNFPIIKTDDTFLGFVFGVVKGVIAVAVICVAVALFVECEFLDGQIFKYFKILTENSLIFNFFCDIYPIDFINVG